MKALRIISALLTALLVCFAATFAAGRLVRLSSAPPQPPAASSQPAQSEAALSSASAVPSAPPAPPIAVAPAANSACPAAVAALPRTEDPAGLVQYTRRATYASVQQQLLSLQQAYPDLLRLSTVGRSAQGRALTLVKLGHGPAKALVVGGIHAREGLSVSYLLRCMEEFCEAYQSPTGRYEEFNMRNLLSVYTLYLLPLANPDGLEIVGGRAEPNVAITYPEKATLNDYKANANGVNLNRNFPFLWEQIDLPATGGHSEYYKGPAAASEPETRALMSLCEKEDFMWLTSVHVRGDCLYWSDATNPSVGASAKVASQLKKRCGIEPCQTSKEVSGYGGGLENWFRQTAGRPGYCLELMPLSVAATPGGDENHRSFDASLRFGQTRAALPVMMVYGYIG